MLVVDKDQLTYMRIAEANRFLSAFQIESANQLVQKMMKNILKCSNVKSEYSVYAFTFYLAMTA